MRFCTYSGRIPVRPMGITAIVAGIPGVRRFQAVRTGLAALQIQLEVLPDADETQVWDAMSSRLHDHLDAQGVHGIHLEKAAELPHQHPISGAFRYVWAEQCVCDARGVGMASITAAAQSSGR